MRTSLFTLLFGAAHAVLVPKPPGPYSVAVKAFELVDPHRKDLLAPKNNDTIRRTMASVYLPVETTYNCNTEKKPYMPALTASVYDKVAAALNAGLPADFFEQFEMENCNISSIQIPTNLQKEQFPVAIFSPGQTASRLLYGALARSLASKGYIIFTLDHAYETTIVEFPDGEVVYGYNIAQANESMYPRVLQQRVSDERFLISQLANKTFTDAIFEDFPGAFDTCKAAVYGHSFGGATAALTVQQEAKAIGGLDFDGTLFGSVVNVTVKGKPFVLVASQVNNRSAPSVLEWDGFYGKLEAAKARFAVVNTTHYAFTDVPLLLTADPVSAKSQPAVNEVFGTLDGRDVERVENEVMGGLLELLFHNDPAPLRNVGRDPDVDVVASSLPE